MDLRKTCRKRPSIQPHGPRVDPIKVPEQSLLRHGQLILLTPTRPLLRCRDLSGARIPYQSESQAPVYGPPGQLSESVCVACTVRLPRYWQRPLGPKVHTPPRSRSLPLDVEESSRESQVLQPCYAYQEEAAESAQSADSPIQQLSGARSDQIHSRGRCQPHAAKAILLLYESHAALPRTVECSLLSPAGSSRQAPVQEAQHISPGSHSLLRNAVN
mmetsp:Transcript_68629/g.128013  ORF Transcript_68629/g.128013 Transcript_68629/m.128013 type:complete len:216 (+) Transcript_68629:412-1059(+)